ncbi:MAG: MotA/TolQ/ExbB proton channel family protein [Pirellulales bacterium]|nr:MotA/TolQ/ExbB proton channel family protein [Pirellulales bacterium]
MNKSSSWIGSFFQSPLFGGGLLAGGFYALIYGGPLDFPLVHRYFTNHPVEFMETVLFSVGLASLLQKIVEFHSQKSRMSESVWGGVPPATSPADKLLVLTARLEELPFARPNDYLIRRLYAALDFVRAHGSGESLDDEMKYRADLDAARIYAGFGLFRLIVWAIPILGFLGTVVGITMALNGITETKLGQDVMAQVLSGLGLKFDTTALALTLSMVLMFAYFYAERMANSFQEQVDRRTQEELAGRFPAAAKGPEGQVAAVRQMAETMLQAADRLVRQQIELWQAALEAAGGRWMQMSKAAGETLQLSLAGALKESLQTHARELAAAEQAAMQQGRNSWEKVLQIQSKAMQNTAALQEAVSRQAEVLERTVQAVGEVARLEDALNRNLSALSGAKHFEQTVASMAAAINLLNAKLAELPSPTSPVKLEPHRRGVPHAA